MIERPRVPIAIVGIGCRFPGGITDPVSFWRALVGGVDAIGDIPPSRFDAAALYEPGSASPGRISTRWGGFLTDIDRLDAAFFGIAPREAALIDPQQRLLLEVSYEAIEDGGRQLDALLGSRTGVFVGLWLNDFESRLMTDPASFDLYASLGTGRYSASGRLSYAFGLQGPSFTIDSACSSSLVAVHLACQSIWSGQCEMALAGGANVILQPHITIAYSQSGMMAADGRCKFGDARADGYVRSEGAGMVLLKPLDAALVDGDDVYAVIRGSAVNNDGRSGESMVKPAQAGQEALLRQAYDDARISPDRVSYVEAHGTGTVAGDPAELGALGSVLGEGRAPGRECFVGSVKTNLGHTEGAAGIAGLIKSALVLRHRTVPSTLHLHELNPAIDWQSLGLVIPREQQQLAAEGELIAGVSSFGIAGTNAHVVLSSEHQPGRARGVMNERPGDTDLLLPLSGRDPGALRERARQLAGVLESGEVAAGDLAFTLARRRPHHVHRRAVVGRESAELITQLREFADNATADEGATGGSTGVVFVFPGQGSQWPGMGRELFATEPVFRAAVESCAAAMRPFTDWSLLELLASDEEAAARQLMRIDVVQPALVALDIALAALWRSWGIEPVAVVGHSMGEVAAAHVAGALSLDDAMRVICVRSRLMRQKSGHGAMAVLELSRDDAAALLRRVSDRVSVAASNGPRSTIISGDPVVIDALLRSLEARGVFCRAVNVDVASHSPQMESLRAPLVAELEGITPRDGEVPFFSTVTGDELRGSELTTGYWSRNLREPVLFGDAVERLVVLGHGDFVEVSPHPVLTAAIQQVLTSTGAAGRALASLRRGEPERGAMLRTLGELYEGGMNVAWGGVYPAGRSVPLPAYPWQRERYWQEPAVRSARAGGHPLFGALTASAAGARTWEGELRLDDAEYLRDHVVRDRIVLPAAAYLEMALSACATLEGATLVVEQVQLEQALILEPDVARPVQALLEPETAGSATFEIYSKPVTGGHAAWTRHARGRLRTEERAPAFRAAGVETTDRDEVAVDAHYDRLAQSGLAYGERFRLLRSIDRGANWARGWVHLAAGLSGAGYRIHPALLDATFQLLLQTDDDGQDAGTYVPVRIGRVRSLRALPDTNSLRVEAVRSSAMGDLRGDIAILGDDGAVLVLIEDLEFRRLPLEGDTGVADWLFGVTWEEAAPATAGSRSATEEHWLLVADSAGVARKVAHRMTAIGVACTIVRTSSEASAGEYANERVLDRFDADSVSGLLNAIRAERGAVTGIADLTSLDALLSGDTDGEMLLSRVRDLTHRCLGITRAAAARDEGSPRLWVVTSGAEGPASPALGVSAGAALWGMAATIGSELPALRASCLDVHAANADAMAESVATELLGGSGEERVAIRDGKRYVARMVRRVPGMSSEAGSGERRVETGHMAASYALETGGAGMLDNLRFRAVARPRPRRGEIEIEVRAAGLNFLNVMSAMGVYPGPADGVGPLGVECAGVVVAIGDGVDRLQPGDEVAAFALDSMATHARADARLAAIKPTSLSFDAAATLPVAYLTAWYALEHLARLERDERVLIHSASGGVGMAAIQLARRSGAEIFATAGSADKRQALEALGVRHVFDSRSLDFADGILECTNGEGVDVVLNSLTGPAIARSLSLLRPFGRFVEIGKRDIYADSKMSMGPFRNHLSYFAVDLLRLAAERPALLGGMMRSIFTLVRQGELRPLPHRAFPASSIVEAFRHMAQSQHVGKVVVTVPPGGYLTGAPMAGTLVRHDATYLITGGTGGVGLTLARWLAEQGARHLVLVARNAARGDAERRSESWRSLACVSSPPPRMSCSMNDLERVFTMIAAEMPPLRGVLHGAGLLSDGTLSEIDLDRFDAAIAPKVSGAWHLHRLTAGMPLDFFVMHSSVASVLGLSGQANYAAANAILDAIARMRNAAGLPALSINWGPWSEAGMAAASSDRGQRLSRQGLGSLSPAQAVASFEHVIGSGREVPQVGIMRFNARRWIEHHAHAAVSPYLSQLRATVPATPASPSAASGALRDVLEARDAGARQLAVERYLRERVAQVFRVSVTRVSLRTPLREQGLDSLMSLELRNRLEAELGIAVPATAIWNYPSVALFAEHLAAQFGERVTTSPSRRPTPQAVTAQPAPVATRTTAELELLLERELDAVNQLLSGD
jgi:acyl transferase domain-containing protein/NADPH:quinone reductase-like Zn-dependent oxidoreductase/acyl carrier protein